MLQFRTDLPEIQTIVIKTGSKILTDKGHEKRIGQLVKDIAELRRNGIRVILVSSGAIAHGMAALGMNKRPSAIPLQQACASIGQNRLMHMYETLFSKYDLLIGQVLLTWDDLRNKKRYLNLRNTFFQLFDCDVVPIVNENDSVGIEEIQFGNNDMLGAQISLLAHADIFVNLTDVGGLYDRNPHTDASATHIPVVSRVSTTLHKFVSDKKNEISVGGMETKLKAAAMVTRAGIVALIGNGYENNVRDILRDPEFATLFLPSPKKMSSRHRWIAFSGQSNGIIVVDDGASKALVKKGKSLLPAGIKSVEGTFKAGDMVDICTEDTTTIARGLSNFSAEELDIIKGSKSTKIASLLGQKKFDEAIHRNNLVIIGSA